MTPKKIKAIVSYNKAPGLDHDNALALFNQGYAYLKYVNRDYAKDDFTKSASLGYEYAREMLTLYFPNQNFENE